jgi:hypothetical protein
MAKHYLSITARGEVFHVYGNDEGTSFRSVPDEIHRLSLSLKVHHDENGRFLSPPITDAQIASALSSILQ